MIALGTRFLVNVHFFPIQPSVKIETYNFAVVDSDNDSYKNNVKKIYHWEEGMYWKIDTIRSGGMLNLGDFDARSCSAITVGVLSSDNFFKWSTQR